MDWPGGITGDETARLTGDRDTQNGKWRQGGGHAWEMSGAACACNDKAETTFFSGASVGNEAEWGAVGAYDTNFSWNPRLAKKGVGGL